MISSGFEAGASLNPLAKTVTQSNPGWLANYVRYPLTPLAPLGGILGALLAWPLLLMGYGLLLRAQLLCLGLLC
jgi:cytochrome d ubiquinol oxidase subunit II